MIKEIKISRLQEGEDDETSQTVLNVIKVYSTV